MEKHIVVLSAMIFKFLSYEEKGALFFFFFLDFEITIIEFSDKDAIGRYATKIPSFHLLNYFLCIPQFDIIFDIRSNDLKVLHLIVLIWKFSQIHYELCYQY